MKQSVCVLMMITIMMTGANLLGYIQKHYLQKKKPTSIET
jgi:hypothetical protein